MPLLETKGAGSAQGFGLSLGSAEAVYIEEVFSTYLYTGNSSTQTITNGIDLDGEGGLVWIKERSNGVGLGHYLFDTGRGLSFALETDTTSAQANRTIAVNAFNSNGFAMGSAGAVNNNGTNYASWTFRKQPKFFDVVTYTGTGSNRTIAHDLGSVPGCIIVKRTDTAGDWQVYHRANTANPETDYLVLNSTAATVDSNTRWNDTLPTATVFSLGTEATVNASGGTYVAYLFAHDAGGFGLTGTDNVISCGTFTGNTTVTLGFEPQWIMLKSTNATGNWDMHDVMRGWPVSGDAARLRANLSDAESQTAQIFPNATGFSTSIGPDTFIYIAIRRGPMKVPTSGTQVFAVNTETEVRSNSSNWTSLSGFPVDLFVTKKVLLTDGTRFIDRLRTYSLTSSNTDAEVALVFATFDTNNGVKMGPVGLSGSSTTYADYLFRRAPGFFDVVCYTGTGANRTVTHNLAAVPELMIVKMRSGVEDWGVYTAATGNTGSLRLNTNGSFIVQSVVWNNTSPTSSVFTVGTNSLTNANTSTYVAYLFATLAGVSKVGSYTGNGTTQVINCGFTAGARFVLIKRTDASENWHVFDTARGINVGNDPALRLDTDIAEFTSAAINPNSSGFEVVQSASCNNNVNAATYIFLAIA